MKKTKDNYTNLVKIGRQSIEKAKLENLYSTDDEEIAKVIQKRAEKKILEEQKKQKLANEEKLANQEKLVNQDKLETENLKLENAAND